MRRRPHESACGNVPLHQALISQASQSSIAISHQFPAKISASDVWENQSTQPHHQKSRLFSSLVTKAPRDSCLLKLWTSDLCIVHCAVDCHYLYCLLPSQCVLNGTCKRILPSRQLCERCRFISQAWPCSASVQHLKSLINFFGWGKLVWVSCCDWQTETGTWA